MKMNFNNIICKSVCRNIGRYNISTPSGSTYCRSPLANFAFTSPHYKLVEKKPYCKTLKHISVMEKKTIKVVVESVSCPAKFNGVDNKNKVHFFTASDLTTGKTLEHALSFSLAKASSFAGFNAFILEDEQTLLDLTKDSKQRVLTCEVLIVGKGEKYTNNKGEQIEYRGFDNKPDDYKLMIIERIKDNAPFSRLAKSREDRFINQENALANFELIKGYPYEAATATPEDIDLFERLVNR